MILNSSRIKIGLRICSTLTTTEKSTYGKNLCMRGSILLAGRIKEREDKGFVQKVSTMKITPHGGGRRLH